MDTLHRMLTKRIEKKLDGNYTRMLQAILNKSWRQQPIKQQLYSHLPPITKTIQVRWTRHVGHSWRNRDELISDVLQWTLSHGWAKAGQPARTYIQQLCADIEGSLEDLPEAMDNRVGWQERVRNIRTDGTIWWWIQTIQFSIIFVYTQLNVKTVLFQTIQFSSIWLIDRSLSGATTPGQSGPGSIGYEGVLHTPQKLQHYRSLTIRLFNVISRTLVGGVLPLCWEMPSVYSTAPVNWATKERESTTFPYF